MQIIDNGICESKLGFLMWLLFVPEMVLFFAVGTDNIMKNYIGIALFFICAILLYSLVPRLVEKNVKSITLPKSKLTFNIAAIIISLATIILKMLLLKQAEPKFLSEYIGFYNAAGIIGLVGATLQHVYYFAEMMLCCYILRLFQQAGDKLFKTKKIPYGGIAIGVLWGFIIHTISKDVFVGLLFLVISIIWGEIYLLSGKNRWPTYLLMSLIFIC